MSVSRIVVLRHSQLRTSKSTAKGDGQFPRLAGQFNDDIIKKLSNWEKERGQKAATPDSSAIMQPIAHNLTPQQIAAVAAYVSTLK
ncbi:MAG: c-type cytochrome [Alphaproteobacteria bacterium]|nr:c-type cytochrome [Alphaproteobacteria bacterium]